MKFKLKTKEELINHPQFSYLNSENIGISGIIIPVRLLGTVVDCDFNYDCYNIKSFNTSFCGDDFLLTIGEFTTEDALILQCNTKWVYKNGDFYLYPSSDYIHSILFRQQEVSKMVDFFQENL